MRAILPSAFHHVAGLDVEIEDFGEILHLKLPDMAGLVDDDASLLQGVVERKKAGAIEIVAPEQQIQAEVFVSVRAGYGELMQVHVQHGSGVGRTLAVRLCN